MPGGDQRNPKNPMEQIANRAVMSSKFQYLPRGLVVAILSRMVCFKTVLNCKCVCKEWLSIISDPLFARLHLPSSPIGILMKIWRSYSSVKKLYLAQIVETAAGSDFGVEKMIFTAKNSELINSCDGLLCSYGPETDGMYVCNPVLGEWISIPPNNNGRRRCGFIALGYITLGPMSTRSCKQPHLTTNSTVSVRLRYTPLALGTGVWRSIGSVPQTILKRNRDEAIQLPFDAFLHGAQHSSI